MLTRLEVRGFKNLVDVDIDFGAFTCFVGGNGVGKSNIFDAIEFLSLLADVSFGEAAQSIRGARGSRLADPRDLFWQNGEIDSDSEIAFAAEMIVQRDTEDDLGGSARASSTFLRYELVLGYEKSTGPASPNPGRIALRHESLVHITKGDAPRRLHMPASAANFRNNVVLGQRRGGAFLSTEERDGNLIINVHGDGGSYGRPQPRPASRTARTVLSTVTTNDHPTVLAARREMQSWRRIALEPTALRTPDEFAGSQSLGSDGSRLAATLYRIAHTPDDDGNIDPEALFARISSRLSDLLGSKVDDIEVELDQVREVYTLYLKERGGVRLPARALSEGTLRFLALCVLLEDPSFTGLICMEEPENGIHPMHLHAMIRLLRDLAVDPMERPGVDNPFRQVAINTHSPGIVQLCETQDLVLARLRPFRSPDNRSTSTRLSLAGASGTWRAQYAPAFELADILPYLSPPAEAQTTLPLDLWEETLWARN